MPGTSTSDSGDDHAAAVTHDVRTLLVETPKTVRFFAGDGDPSRAQDFCEQVRRAWSSLPTNASNARKLDIIYENIGPAVRSELRCADVSAMDNPEEVLKVILSVFGERRSPFQLQQLLSHQKQLNGESVREYSNRLMGHFTALQNRQRTLNMPLQSEDFLLQTFLLTLSDVSLTRMLRREVKDNPGLTFRDVRKIAIEYLDDGLTARPEADPAIVSAVAAAQAETQMLRELLAQQTKMMEGMMEKLNALSTAPAPVERPPAPHDRRRQIICWSCKQVGHIANRCPNSRQGNGGAQRR